jgi:hypothetical protein
MIFGRPGGPARAILAIVAVGVVVVLGVTVGRLNTRLSNQEAANQHTLTASHAIVDVNDHVTNRLRQLDLLTDTANQALSETKALGPLLDKLHEAVKPAAAAVTIGRTGGEVSEAKLNEIQSILAGVRQNTLSLVSSAQKFGSQGSNLLTVVRGLVSDIQHSVAAAKRINESLPLPG